MTHPIRIYHSPDADDRFMFWPLRMGLVKTNEFLFEFLEADTQSLNDKALSERPEVCAISAVHYGRVHTLYQPLLMGASVGNGYGPIVVTPNGMQSQFAQAAPGSENFKQATLLTPGLKTTAHAIVSLLGYAFKRVEVVPIAPMERVFERLHAIAKHNEPVVALLIHEGRLIYKNFDTSLLFDVGESWSAVTGTRLPLGINVIRRDLPIEMRQSLSKLLSESCHYAMEHRAEYIALATESGGYYHTPLSKSELERYLDMYANADTLIASEPVQRSFKILINRALECGWIEADGPVLFDWI